METGIWALVGVFVVAAALLVASFRRAGAVRAKLLGLGFEPCDGQAETLRAALTEIAGALGAATPRELRVAHCLRLAAGWGFVHRMEVLDETHADTERQAIGGRFDAYLIDLRDAGSVAHRPVSVYVAPGPSKLFSAVMRRMIELDPPGAPLEVRRAPGLETLIAAFGAAPGKLDDALPVATQERVARAGPAGFFALQFAGPRAVFYALPDAKDVAKQWQYVSEWL